MDDRTVFEEVRDGWWNTLKASVTKVDPAQRPDEESFVMIWMPERDAYVSFPVTTWFAMRDAIDARIKQEEITR